MRQRPVRGKKKPSATILARALGMGFERLASTWIREEKVRILRALGPERLSAARRAMGWIIDFSRFLETASTGADSRA